MKKMPLLAFISFTSNFSAPFFLESNYALFKPLGNGVKRPEGRKKIKKCEYFWQKLCAERNICRTFAAG